MSADYELRAKWIEAVRADPDAMKWAVKALKDMARGCEQHEHMLTVRAKHEQRTSMAAAMNLVADIYGDLGDEVVHEWASLEES